MIRRAEPKDLPRVNELLLQVLTIHAEGRPDIFIPGTKKYTDDELLALYRDDSRPLFVCTGTEDRVLGYAFCIFQRHERDNILTDIKTLYIDDLCVDEPARGAHVGTALYRFVTDFAKESGCYNVTLNVWAGNDSAKAFYEKCGLKPQKYGMETIL